MDPADPATASVIEACAVAVTNLAARRLPVVIEPFMVHRPHGRPVNDLSPDAVIRAIAIASGLGATSAYSWLKIPVVADMERVAESFTLPALLLGGDTGDRRRPQSPLSARRRRGRGCRHRGQSAAAQAAHRRGDHFGGLTVRLRRCRAGTLRA
jgi:hypothetical protein